MLQSRVCGGRVITIVYNMFLLSQLVFFFVFCSHSQFHTFYFLSQVYIFPPPPPSPPNYCVVMQSSTLCCDYSSLFLWLEYSPLLLVFFLVSSVALQPSTCLTMIDKINIPYRLILVDFLPVFLKEILVLLNPLKTVQSNKQK